VVRRLIFSNTSLLGFMGGSRPRGEGTQAGFEDGSVGVCLALVVVPFLAVPGELAVGTGLKDVTPAHVEGVMGLGVVFEKRSMSFSERNILPKLSIWRPVLDSSRTVGGPSIMVILFRSSCLTTSSRKGA